MKFFKFLLKRYIIFSSIIVSLVIASIIWITIGWVAYYDGRENEIKTESEIVFDIVVDIINHDSKLIKNNLLQIDEENTTPTYKNFSNFFNNKHLNSLNLFFNNIISMYKSEYAEEKLKIFDNLYIKHWLEVKDSKDNILIQTKYKYDGSYNWDDKYYEEKKVVKTFNVDNEIYIYTYACKYRPYWYIALVRSMSLYTIPDAFENKNFSWNKWKEETFLNVGKWEQIFSFWIIFLILMLFVPFALKNIYDLYKALRILRYRNVRYNLRLKVLIKHFNEEKKRISQEKNLSADDITKKEKELKEIFDQKILALKSEHNRQISSVKSGFSKYYDHAEKDLDRYKTTIKQQLKEIEELRYKLQEHNINYDPYKFTEFKFRDKADILILGGEGSISSNEAFNILRELGLSHNTDIKWISYREMEHFDITAIQNNRNYSDIIVGAIPHSLPNVPEQNLVSHLQNNSSIYPKFQILRKQDDGDLLQITKNNLREALKNSNKYKQLIELQKLNLYKK